METTLAPISFKLSSGATLPGEPWDQFLETSVAPCCRRVSSRLDCSLSCLLIFAVHLGVCHSENCHHRGPGPCGCPDCTKPHPPHAFHNYCDNSDYGSDTYEGSDSNAAEAGDNKYRYYGGDSTSAGQTGQTGSSLSYGWWLLIAAAAVAVTGAAYAMRKRVRVDHL